MEGAFEQRLYFHGRELQWGFLGEALHVLNEGICAFRILTNLSGQGVAAGFTMRTRGDARGLLPDDAHRLPNLVRYSGHRFAERSQLVALHQVILEAVDAGVSIGKMPKRTK